MADWRILATTRQRDFHSDTHAGQLGREDPAGVQVYETDEGPAVSQIFGFVAISQIAPGVLPTGDEPNRKN